MKKGRILLMIMMFVCICARGQQSTCDIRFETNSAEYRDSYLGNGRNLSRLEELVKSVGADNVNTVEIYSIASPEGSTSKNLELSRDRVKSLENVVKERFPELSGKIVEGTVGESWNGLREYVYDDGELSNAEKLEIVTILDARNVSASYKKNHLKQHPRYKYLLVNYYPKLRRSGIKVTYGRKAEVPAAVAAPVAAAPTAAVAAAPAVQPAVAETPITVIPAVSVTPSAQPFRDTLNLMVYFKQGSYVLEENYRDNGKALRRFVAEMNRLESLGEGSVLWPMEVKGCVSPEGSDSFNEILASNRARVTYEWILNHSDIKPYHISPKPVGVDWDRVLMLLDECEPFPGKEEAIDMLRSHPDEYRRGDGTVVTKTSQLKTLAGGQAWNWMSDNIFWKLRTGSSITAVTTVPVRDKQTDRDTVWVTKTDTLYVGTTVRDTVVAPCPEDLYIIERERLFAFRSNLLLPLMNIGIEYPIAPHWSLEADWHYPWLWPAKANKDCFELLCLTAGFRWWMRKPRDASWRGRTDLTGPSLGLNAMAGYYDFERDYKGRQGEFAGAQLDFTYGVRLGKSAMRMEFTIGAGYVYTQSRTYHVKYDGGLLLHDNHLEYINHWIGPTKLAVALVIPISRKVRVPMSREEYEERYGVTPAPSLGAAAAATAYSDAKLQVNTMTSTQQPTKPETKQAKKQSTKQSTKQTAAETKPAATQTAAATTTVAAAPVVTAAAAVPANVSKGMQRKLEKAAEMNAKMEAKQAAKDAAKQAKKSAKQSKKEGPR